MSPFEDFISQSNKEDHNKGTPSIVEYKATRSFNSFCQKMVEHSTVRNKRIQTELAVFTS